MMAVLVKEGINMGFKGYDFFTALPDTVDEMVCKVCGEVCDAKRGVSGPMSWAGAMAKKNTPHDSFSCPHSDAEWHEQALKIVRAIEDCHSPSINRMMEKDLKIIIKKKKVME
jgi:hypothetical protein